MVGGVDTWRESGATQESVTDMFEKLIWNCCGGDSLPVNIYKSTLQNMVWLELQQLIMYAMHRPL